MLQTVTTTATALEFHLRKVPGRIYGGITPVCSLPAFYFTVGQALAHTPPNQGRVGAMGRHAFGSFSASRRSWWAILRQCTRLCLLVDTSYQAYLKTYLWIRLAYLSKNFFVLELQWILLVFAFWPHQKTSFEASERNKDASHAPTARKLTLDAPHTIRVAAFLARASPNRFLKTKLAEEERGGREQKKKEGEREEKGRRGASKQPP